MPIVIATNNQNKVREIREIIADDSLELYSLKDLNLDSDPEETGSTFLENATIKAESACEALKVAGLSGYTVIADDSGLCVDALDGGPGVYSARYAEIDGNPCTYDDNNTKLLTALSQVAYEDRTAHFETAAIMITPDGIRKHCTGKLPGHIAFEKSGTNGFGYDPIFIPDILSFGIPNESKITLAEFSAEQKDAISHRGQAFRKLVQAIKN